MINWTGWELQMMAILAIMEYEKVHGRRVRRGPIVHPIRMFTPVFA